MAQSALRLVKRWHEYLSQEDISRLPLGLRGVYVLYKHRAGHYNVVYVGMSATGATGIKRRLRAHRKMKRKLWSHFSVFEVWDNIRDEEIKELEGLFRQIYRYDSRANALNVQRGFKPLRLLDRIDLLPE
jgi:hypothetical protein